MVILLSAAALWVIIAVLLAALIGRSIRLADRKARNAAPPSLPRQESGPADDAAAARLEAMPRARTRPPRRGPPTTSRTSAPRGAALAVHRGSSRSYSRGREATACREAPLTACPASDSPVTRGARVPDAVQGVAVTSLEQ
jgi:hypothetical protein